MNCILPSEKLLENFLTYPDMVAFHQPENRIWKTYTWSEVQHAVNQIIVHLRRLGLQKGDCVAIYSKNTAEWIITDWAIMLAGMISVPVYPTANVDTVKYILDRTKTKAIFIGKLDAPEVAEKAIGRDTPSIALPAGNSAATYDWSDWISQPEQFVDYHHPGRNEVMSIMYTSGSTGNPKGVELTQLAYATACTDSCNMLNVREGDRLFSYLPLAHIAERVVTEGLLLYSKGVSAYFSESLETFTPDLQYAKPTIFFSVPRLWDKFLSNVYQVLPQRKINILLTLPLISRAIKRKIKRKLGFEHTRAWITAAAPISETTLHAFAKLGINISEAWGMTETTGGGCINYPFRTELIGTIGFPYTHAAVRLSEEGELQVKGENVYRQYHLNPEATAESFTEDGWFRTGDRGMMNKNGAFKIVGRLKEEFKTSSGKYIIPVPIETKLTQSSLVEMACVTGSHCAHPYAIVVLAESAPTNKKDIESALLQLLSNVNNTLESHQKLSHMLIAATPWTIDNNLLTPTMKIKRYQLEKRYQTKHSDQSKLSGVVWESNSN